MKVRLWKEFRALLVIWALGLPAILLGAGLHYLVALQVLFVFTVALGAWAVGHELNYRTASMALAQPLSRRRYYFEKIAVVVAMVATLAVAMVILEPDRWPRILVVAGVGLSMSIWLTLQSNNVSGGIVFTIAVTLVSVVGVTVVGGLLSEWRPDLVADSSVFQMWAAQWALPPTLVVVSLLGWWKFSSLEAVDERDDLAVVNPWILGRSSDRALLRQVRNPLIALIRKELDLQQVVLVVSALYLFGWFASWQSDDVAFRERVIYGATMVHGWIVPMLAGSLASAEERRLGTLEWQMQIPIAARWQWVVKVATVTSLALLLSIGLPALLAGFDPSAFQNQDVLSREVVFIVLGLVISALYVSSLSQNGLQALVVSIPGALLLMFPLGSVAASWLFNPQWMLRLRGDTTVYAFFALMLLVVVVYALLALKFALANHRTVAQPRRQLVEQFVALAVYPLAAVVWLRVTALALVER